MAEVTPNDAALALWNKATFGAWQSSEIAVELRAGKSLAAELVEANRQLREALAENARLRAKLDSK